MYVVIPVVRFNARTQHPSVLGAVYTLYSVGDRKGRNEGRNMRANARTRPVLCEIK